jgi:4-hydroxybutyrate dehydrogenase
MALINYITQVQFDFGALAGVAAECGRVGIQRPLICTDRGIVAAGLLNKLNAALGEVPGRRLRRHAGQSDRSRGARCGGRIRQHHADGLIALGGGSSIDLAKAVAIAATHEGPLTRYATIEGGSPRIGAGVAPLIAIPTTAGTGSEVARGAIIIVDDGRKLGFHSWHLVPKVAICDPELTLGLPPGLTAATGMDAMAHCIETYLSKAVNPPADAIAFDGLRGRGPSSNGRCATAPTAKRAGR